MLAAMERLTIIAATAALGVLLAGCGPKGSEVETVPASVLDPDKHSETKVATRKEYKSVKKEDTPIFPIPDNAYSTGSGLRFVVFERGKEMVHPISTTNVTVHYEGYTSDKKLFDSSVERGQPTTFVLQQVIPGWREGVKLMTAGDTFRFWIPEKDAYRGAPGKPAGLLIFDVQLIALDRE